MRRLEKAFHCDTPACIINASPNRKAPAKHQLNDQFKHAMVVVVITLTPFTCSRSAYFPESENDSVVDVGGMGIICIIWNVKRLHLVAY